MNKNLRYLMAQANDGAVNAQVDLGDMYYKGNTRLERWFPFGLTYGRGLARDYKKAMYWFEQAAKKGNDYAKTTLGVMYGRGHGVKQDYNKAAKLYLEAALAGNMYAQFNLGIAYINGRGVPKSDELAIKYFNMAAFEGDGEMVKALYELGMIYWRRRDIDEKYYNAIDCFVRAADRGHEESKNNIEIIKKERTKILENKAKDIEEEANRGCVKSQREIGDICRHGRGVPVDNEKAAKWYEKAAEQGYGYCQEQIGMFYMTGTGVIQNDEKAVYWLKKAIDTRGGENAKLNLAKMYELGHGVEQNSEKATEILRDIVDSGFGSEEATRYLATLRGADAMEQIRADKKGVTSIPLVDTNVSHNL